MKKSFSKSQIQEADSVSIVNIAQKLGLELKKTDKKSLKCLNHGGLYIYPENNKFFNFSTGKSGGVISFVQYVNESNFLDSMNWINEHFSLSEDFNKKVEKPDFTHKALEKTSKEEKNEELILPKRKDNDKKLIWYLTQQRKIDKSIVFKCLKNGSIYQDERNNIIFLGKNKDGHIKYALLQGTGEKRFKGELEHSQKQYGFELSAKDTSKVIVTESPIDAMSFKTLKMKQDKNFDIPIISLGGGADHHLEQYLEDHQETKEIILALDNDYLDKKNWGQINAEHLIEKYSSNYEVKNLIPVLKDWNEELIQISKGLTIEDLELQKKEELTVFHNLIAHQQIIEEISIET